MVQQNKQTVQRDIDFLKREQALRRKQAEEAERRLAAKQRQQKRQQREGNELEL